MDRTRPRSATTRAKLLRTIRKLVHLQAAAKPIPNCAVSNTEDGKGVGERDRRRAALEALLAKLFASVSSIKAAYAELQSAQSPRDAGAIRSSDEALVEELAVLSDLEQGFRRKEADPYPPYVTTMLAEAQEQQSLIRTYQLTLNRLEAQREHRDSELASLRAQLLHCDRRSRSLQCKLDDAFGNEQPASLNPTHFLRALHSASKSVRSFVEQLVCEMESASWVLESAAVAIHPNTVFVNQTQRRLAFESFVAREMFEGFNSPSFWFPEEPDSEQIRWFERFNELKSENPKRFMASNPGSPFAAFTKAKYLKLVHPKMECSFFGHLRQRNAVSAGKCPDAAFFVAFAEMAKRTWLLHCLAHSFEAGARAFQVRKNSPFSEVFMEAVEEEESVKPSGGDLRVAFTVAPGFTIGKTVIRCRVLLYSA